MKRFARQRSALSLVPASTEQTDSAQEASSSSLSDYFDGWLSSIRLGPLNPAPAPDQEGMIVAHRRRPLTITDLVRVNRATVRESVDHRPWPPEVVEKFLAAEVIRKR